MLTKPERNAAGRTVSWLGTHYTITVDRRASGGTVGMFVGEVPAGNGPPIHIHHNEDEVIHVLDGDYEMWLDGSISRLMPGQSIFLPRGVPHTFRVAGRTPGRNIAVLTPGGFEQFFPEVAARDLKIPQDMAALAELAGDYGLEFLGMPEWPA